MSLKRTARGEAGRNRSKTPRFISYSLDNGEDEVLPAGSRTTHSLHTTISSSKPGARPGASVHSTSIATQASPTKELRLSFPVDDHSVDVDGLSHDGDNVLSAGVEQQPEGGIDEEYHWRCHEKSEKEGTKRPRYPADQPLRQWIPHRQSWLDELVQLEGRGEAMHSIACSACSVAQPEYRCVRCFGNGLWCKPCTILLHGARPFHLVERWNGEFFDRVTLKSLGLRVQLMHPCGLCTNPVPAPVNFIVIDIDSIQEASVDYCGCQNAPDPTTQLLRSRLFPATTITPATVATHRVLQHYHASTVQSKVSAFDFYRTIERRTDSTELQPPPDRYPEFLRMARMWRHLKLLKRGGRGQIPDGVTTTQEGDLALPCPACPQPGINLPDDWESWPEADQWLFNLILALDANFRLRRRDISSDEADPPLGSGLVYFVEHLAYKTHLAAYAGQKDISSCSNHAAISQANTKPSKGLATTGVGACVCARHQMLRPNGVGDLQRGERYCNMDYVLLSTLRFHNIKRLVVSYDIACQWHKNLQTRMENHPPAFRLDLSRTLLRFVIPKFHLPAHHQPCHAPFSFNYALGVGRTDGEGIERDWSVINPVASSTRKMTPGHRADTLDDHWADVNWKKMTGMGRALARKMRAAVPECIKHTQAFRAMCDALPAARVEEWTRMVEEWEKESAVEAPRNVKAPNPYELQAAEITQAEVRLQLAEADAASLVAGQIAMHECTPAQLLITGIQLQEQQLRLREERQELCDGTAPQRAMLQERRNLLVRKLDAWELIQGVYMPGVPQLRINLARRVEMCTKLPPFAAEVEERPMFFPSDVVGSDGVLSLDSPLRSLELKLREAQAHDALRDVRHFLRLLTFTHKYKNKHCRGQHENTRTGHLIKRSEAKKAASVRRYRLAHAALCALDPGRGAWSHVLRELKDVDVRGLTDLTGAESEGQRVVSWIWMVPGVGGGVEAEDVGLHDSLRVEWCKTRARACRWREEIQLLRAEMARVDKWLSWRSSWWRVLGGQRDEPSPLLKEGLRVYAARQAHIHSEMRQQFADVGQRSRAFMDAEIAHAEGSKKTD